MSRVSYIPAKMTVQGEIEGRGDLIIGGRVEGPIEIDGSVTIEEGAQVLGTVRAPNIEVFGTLRGDALAADTLKVGASAVVVGDARAPRLNVAEGARIRGRVEMKAGGPAPRQPAPPKRTQVKREEPVVAAATMPGAPSPAKDFDPTETISEPAEMLDVDSGATTQEITEVIQDSKWGPVGAKQEEAEAAPKRRRRGRRRRRPKKESSSSAESATEVSRAESPRAESSATEVSRAESSPAESPNEPSPAASSAVEAKAPADEPPAEPAEAEAKPEAPRRRRRKPPSPKIPSVQRSRARRRDG